MERFQVGVQLYTVRESCQTAEGLIESLKKIAAIGYRAVEASPFGPLKPDRLKEVLDGEGLTMPSTHIGLEQIENETAKTTDTLLLFDCRHVALSGPAHPDAAGYRAFAERLTRASHLLAEAGIALSYHNHHWEFQRFDGKPGLQILIEASEPSLNFQLDTYWVQEGGGDPIWWIQRVSGRIPFLHVKDRTIIASQVHMAEVGEGNLNWKGILEAARAAGTRWLIVEQDHCDRDPFESIAMSLRNLQAMGVA